MTDLRTPTCGLLTRWSLAALALVGAASLGACRGGIKKAPPVHLVLDMDFQQKLKAQMGLDFEFWADGRAMRTPPAGTVARGSLTDDPLETFQDADGNYLDNPVAATAEVLARGRERFGIYCAACHDRSGSGMGLVLQRAKASSPAAFNYAVPDLGKEPRLVEAKDGYLYQVIAKGQGTMPAYAHQIPVADRWAIVHYVRALQTRFQ
jgi:mono/diheme cytochrome c family protein